MQTSSTSLPYEYIEFHTETFLLIASSTTARMSRTCSCVTSTSSIFSSSCIRLHAFPIDFAVSYLVPR